MTREQAKREIDSLDYYLQNHTDDYSEESHTAMKMAISALSENKGEWKQISPAGIYECSCCGQYVLTSDIECYKFCHGCGAKMKGEESEKNRDHCQIKS